MRSSSATVTVHDHDHGRGIREEDLQRIFDRLYRAVEAGTEPGSGLGLAIVAEFVRGHSGRVFAHNRAGVEVGFSIPT